MSGHTEGPWTRSPNGRNVLAPDGWVVATCYDQPKKMLQFPEISANARLIAAAPDLLEAAETLLAQLTPLHVLQGELEYDHQTPVKGWCEMLEAAIAKAKCES